MITNRVIWKAAVLSIITFGIYGIVWQVKVKGELNKSGAEIPTAWWLIVPIGNIWWLWKYSQGAEKVIKEKYSAPVIFLLLFITSIIGQAILQVELNRLAKPMSKEDIAKSKKSTIALILGLLLFLIIITAIVATGNSENNTKQTQEDTVVNSAQTGRQEEVEQKQKDAIFSAEIIDYSPIDPATLMVMVKVTNSGDVAKAPSCKISGSNTSGSYKGFDFFELADPIEPGASYTFNGNIVITNEESIYVTQVTADCS